MEASPHPQGSLRSMRGATFACQRKLYLVGQRLNVFGLSVCCYSPNTCFDFSTYLEFVLIVAWLIGR